MVITKRIYEKPTKKDGLRILIDRLWPRGVSKAEAKIDLWLKDIAPSDKLRKWFGHEPEKCSEFRKRYFKELDSKCEQVEQIFKEAESEDVTLLYAAKDENCNNATALKEYLQLKKHRLK